MKILRAYPQETVIDGETYRYERILKEDFFSVNVLYRGDSGAGWVLKLSDFRFFLGLLLRPMAILMSRHEYRIYRMLADLAGVPRLGGRYGLRGYFHEFIEGKTLHELSKGEARLPEDFFDRLRVLIDRIHERRVFYADLNKRGNIILSDDGRPYLIDFQISLHFGELGGAIGRWADRVFHRLIRADIYHLYKHKKRFQRELMSEGELELAERSEMIRTYDRLLGRRYRGFKRLFYPKGSNEMVWYKWRRQKDQTKRMP